MYQTIQIGRKRFFVSIAILAAVFIAIYDNYVFADEKPLKSEEDAIDETRSNIEKYLSGAEEKKSYPVTKLKAAPIKKKSQSP